MKITNWPLEVTKLQRRKKHGATRGDFKKI